MKQRLKPKATMPISEASSLNKIFVKVERMGQQRGVYGLGAQAAYSYKQQHRCNDVQLSDSKPTQSDSKAQ